MNHDVNAQVGRDLALAEAIAVPIILVLLVLAFGSLVAALLPLAIGTIAIFGTFAELVGARLATDVSIFSINLTTALGLGLSIDYALLMVSRYREELGKGADVDAAVDPDGRDRRPDDRVQRARRSRSRWPRCWSSRCSSCAPSRTPGSA